MLLCKSFFFSFSGWRSSIDFFFFFSNNNDDDDVDLIQFPLMTMVLYLLLSQDVINVSSMLFRDEDEVRREKEKQRNQEDNDVVFHVDFIACLFYFSSLGSSSWMNLHSSSPFSRFVLFYYKLMMRGDLDQGSHVFLQVSSGYFLKFFVVIMSLCVFSLLLPFFAVHLSLYYLFLLCVLWL